MKKIVSVGLLCVSSFLSYGQENSKLIKQFLQEASQYHIDFANCLPKVDYESKKNLEFILEHFPSSKLISLKQLEKEPSFLSELEFKSLHKEYISSSRSEESSPVDLKKLFSRMWLEFPGKIYLLKYQLKRGDTPKIKKRISYLSNDMITISSYSSDDVYSYEDTEVCNFVGLKDGSIFVFIYDMDKKYIGNCFLNFDELCAPLVLYDFKSKCQYKDVLDFMFIKKSKQKIQKKKNITRTMFQKHVASEETIHTDSINPKKVIFSQNNPISILTIEVFDYQKSDGDTVDLYLNGKLLKKDLIISQKSFSFEAPSGETSLVSLRVKSEGSIKTCTGTISVLETGQTFSFQGKVNQLLQMVIQPLVLKN